MTDKFSLKSTYGIGVDIGGTKILVLIADDSGNVVLREKTKTSRDIDEIIDTVCSYIKKTGIPFQQIAGIGLGVPGRVNSRKGLALDSPALQWVNLELKVLFGKKLGLPIFVHNDVSLAVMGERWLGNGKNSDNIFYLAVGTGVGSAIITNGEIIEGFNFSAGEIGYFIDKNDIQEGRKNSFLDFGTFERKTSGTTLDEKGLEYGYSPPKLFEQYRSNNLKVIPIIKDFVLDISIAIANVISLINPEIVIIGGGVSESMGCVIEEIKSCVKNLNPIPTKIELSKLGGEAGAFGGIACVFEEVKKLKKSGG